MSSIIFMKERIGFQASIALTIEMHFNFFFGANLISGFKHLDINALDTQYSPNLDICLV